MGPVGFRGPSKGPMGFRGPIAMTLKTEYVEDRRPFFLRSHQNPEKIVVFSLKTFFFFSFPFYFLRSHQNPEEIVAFSPSVLECTQPKMPNI